SISNEASRRCDSGHSRTNAALPRPIAAPEGWSDVPRSASAPQPTPNIISTSAMPPPTAIHRFPFGLPSTAEADREERFPPGRAVRPPVPAMGRGSATIPAKPAAPVLAFTFSEGDAVGGHRWVEGGGEGASYGGGEPPTGS